MKINKGGPLEKFVRFLFSAATLGFALYGLITGDFRFQYLMLLGLSGVMAITGMDDYERGKKFWSYASFAVAIFCLVVAVQIFFTDYGL
ncbi:hypothetical protein [Salimicrobium halophilum]|uniref:DUF3953 domain-containing protein n=1 Tax=Salimicrobium halophilum TaxID=86666 RepID=A0A1G8R825_9BACI|nr:hypothetical protein [Salimicrobium halophilum]SDJ12540.1 hypothetical protein SAMN04490247_0857 [Salimicrobium halophilum]